MPLINIDNQPLGFNHSDTKPSDCFGCDTRDEYCIPFLPGDPVFQQFTQTPCQQSIACDGDFSAIDSGAEAITDGNFNALGTEEIVNGTFTGNANGWTLGTGWAYNVNNVRKTAGVASNISQILSNPTVANAVYRVDFTIANRTAGTITATLYSGPNVSGAVVSTNATHTQYIKTTGSCIGFSLTASSTFDGDIDSISVKRITASWDFGDEWFISAGGFAAITNSLTNTSFLQVIGAINATTDYTVSIDIEAGGSGGMRVFVGGTGSAFFTLTGAAQTITFNITSAATFDFSILGTIGANIEISSVSVIEIDGACWDFNTNLWTIGTESLCKIPGSGDTLTNAATLTADKYYQVKISVVGMTQGEVQMSVNAITGALITADGTYTQYFTPAVNSNVVIYADAAFDGCLFNFEIFELKKDFVFQLIDPAGNLVAIISDNGGIAYNRVRYDEDYVTIKFLLDEILDTGGHNISYGCYRIYSFDTCELQYEEIVTDGDFALTPDSMLGYIDGTYWVSDGDPFGTIDIIAEEIVFDNPGTSSTGMDIFNCWDGYDAVTLSYLQNPKIPMGAHNYRIEFDVLENNDPVNILMQVFMGGSNVYANPSTVGHHTLYLYNVDPTLTNRFVRFICNFTGVSGHVRADNISVHRIEPYDTTFTSKCIEYKDPELADDCLQYMQAYGTDDNMGFKFYDDFGVNIFKLGHRLYIRSINPNYPEEKETDLYSEGTKGHHYAQSEETFTLLTDHLPEWIHKTIRIQRICEHFEIGNPLGTFKEWYCLPGDLQPEWTRTADSHIAPVRFEIQKKIEGVKFFRRL